MQTLTTCTSTPARHKLIFIILIARISLSTTDCDTVASPGCVARSGSWGKAWNCHGELTANCSSCSTTNSSVTVNSRRLPCRFNCPSIQIFLFTPGFWPYVNDVLALCLPPVLCHIVGWHILRLCLNLRTGGGGWRGGYCLSLGFLVISGVARICCEEGQSWRVCHGALTAGFGAGCSSCSMTNSFVTNAVLIERGVSLLISASANLADYTILG